MRTTPPPPSPPPVLLWQRLYCAAMAALYLLCLLGGLAFAVFRHQLADAKSSPTEMLIGGLVMAAVSLPLVAIYLAGIFLPRRRWAWIVHVVLIAIGMTSCCCLPVCVPLLIFWIRPEVQEYFTPPPAG